MIALLLALRAIRSARAATEADVAEEIATAEARIRRSLRELEHALARTRDESRRNARAAEFAGLLDLDDVLARTLAATSGASHADAAAVWLFEAAEEGKPLLVTSGLSPEEAEREASLGGPPGIGAPRSVAFRYRYVDPALEAGEEVLRSGLAVPVVVGDRVVGQLAVLSRKRDADFGDEASAELSELALAAGPTLENARRFREARQLADFDALTGLHNRRYFHETLAREVARAHRYDRRLALIVLDADDFKAVNDRIGHLAGDGVLAEVAERLRGAVRSADVACRVGGDEFGVILPESGAEDAEQLRDRIQQAVAGTAIGEAGRVGLSAGIAELRLGDDPAALFQRADQALYRAKAAQRGTAAAAAR